MKPGSSKIQNVEHLLLSELPWESGIADSLIFPAKTVLVAAFSSAI
jgi:hypothetical protein